MCVQLHFTPYTLHYFYEFVIKILYMSKIFCTFAADFNISNNQARDGD